jgi:hypothetical protein
MAYQFSDKEKVKGGAVKRTRRRLKRTGKVKGVNPKDGFTGKEIRRVKRADLREKGADQKTNRKRGEQGTGILGQASDIADFEYGRAEHLLADEIRREEAHSKTIGQAFDGYQRRMGELAKASQDAAAAAGQQFGAAANTAAGAVQGMNEQANAEVAQRAEMLGFTGGQAVGHAQSLQQQAGAYQAGQAGTIAKGIATAGLGETNDLLLRSGIGERERIDQFDKGRKRVDVIEGKKRDLQREKSNFRTKTALELQQQAREAYIAITGLRQEALSDKADRRLQRQLGLMDLQGELAQIESDERMNREDNATDLAEDRQNGGSGGSGGSGGRGSKGLSPSQRREWKQKKSYYQGGAARMRKNLARYKDRDSAWHATAQELGGRMKRADLVAMWWIAKGGKIPKDVLLYLQGRFPGGKSPWG